jgi:hypothetical protein
MWTGEESGHRLCDEDIPHEVSHAHTALSLASSTRILGRHALKAVTADGMRQSGPGVMPNRR